MEKLTAILVLSLLAEQALCQFALNPAMLMLSGGGAGAGAGGLGALAGLGMAGAEMGGSLQDMMMMQLLMGGGGGGGANNAGTSGGSTGGTGGGLDPMTLMALGGGGAGGSSDLLQSMMMMNMFSNNQGSGGQPASGASNIANLLSNGDTSTSITPGQQNALWGLVSMTSNTQRIMDAVTTPTDRVALERDGLPGVNPMMAINMCPSPTQCGLAICENAEIPFTPESFYICRGCPRCRMDPGQRNLMTMLSRMGGSGGAGRGMPMI